MCRRDDRDGGRRDKMTGDGGLEERENEELFVASALLCCTNSCGLYRIEVG